MFYDLSDKSYFQKPRRKYSEKVFFFPHLLKENSKAKVEIAGDGLVW